MRSYISFGELEELGETIVREYLRKTKRYNALCVDIEGLVTDYLGLTVVYENIAEDDPNKIAFLSNGTLLIKVARETSNSSGLLIPRLMESEPCGSA